MVVKNIKLMKTSTKRYELEKTSKSAYYILNLFYPYHFYHFV